MTRLLTEWLPLPDVGFDGMIFVFGVRNIHVSRIVSVKRNARNGRRDGKPTNKGWNRKGSNVRRRIYLNVTLLYRLLI